MSFVFPNYIIDGAALKNSNTTKPSVMLYIYIKKEIIIKTHLIIRVEHNETMGNLQTLFSDLTYTSRYLEDMYLNDIE